MDAPTGPQGGPMMARRLLVQLGVLVLVGCLACAVAGGTAGASVGAIAALQLDDRAVEPDLAAALDDDDVGEPADEESRGTNGPRVVVGVTGVLLVGAGALAYLRRRST